MTSFDRRTGLLPDLIAETIIATQAPTLSEYARAWFIRDTDNRMRRLYQRRPSFKKLLERDQTPNTAYAFISHWLNSFCKNQTKYMAL